MILSNTKIKKPLAIIGSGQQAKLTEEAAILQDHQIGLILSESNEKQYLEDDSFRHEHCFIIAIGDNSIRKNVAKKYLNLDYINIIHPSSFISPTALLGQGNFIGPKAVIHTHAKIGDHCLINTSSVVEHDCTIHNYAHIAPGAVLTGTVHVGESVFIGANAVIPPGVKVKNSEYIKAGSVYKGDA